MLVWHYLSTRLVGQLVPWMCDCRSLKPHLCRIAVKLLCGIVLPSVHFPQLLTLCPLFLKQFETGRAGLQRF